MKFHYHDGGRQVVGMRGRGRDCVVRAIAIALERPYAEVAAELERLYGLPAHVQGIPRAVYHAYLAEAGWTWTPTMGIGTGCTVHLRAEDLPAGRLLVKVSRHLVAVVDGVIHDTHDPTRGGRRCVYGYYQRGA